MTFFQIWLIGLLVVVIAMTALWLYSLRIRNSSIIDIYWGPGFVLVALVYLLLIPATQRSVLVMLLVAVWGLRLGIHLGWRNTGKGEDFRYAKWREETGAAWWWQSYLRVFLLQGAILSIVSVPLLAAMVSNGTDGLMWLDYLAILVWIIGFSFEAVGDWQLVRFKGNPQNKGRVMDTGLWRYTRHPNYFGDAVVWWGFYLFAFSAGYFWTIFSPMLMTYLLMRVSGVAMLERTLKVTKPQYADYVARTSAFFPWLPRK